MRRRYIWFISAILVISVALLLPIILPDEYKSITPIIGTVGVGFLLVILKKFFFGNEVPRSEKKEHTKSINEVYELLTIVELDHGRGEERWKYFLKFPKEYYPDRPHYYHDLEEGVTPETLYEGQLKYESVYLYYDSAIEHLKDKYKHIYKHWKKVKTMLYELSSKTSIEKELEDRIKEKMKECFDDFENNLLKSKHYDISNIRQFIMAYFKYADRSHDYDLKFLKYDKSNEYKEIYLSWKHNAVHMRSDSEIDFEKYKQLVTEIVNDESLKNFYHEYGSKYGNIVTELNCFKDELEKIKDDLKRRPFIEGKCRSCP